ncbi:MAG: PHP domain-containing protein, partial [Lachnospiraceae bacterium]|nr:PHP domain-containing protein [Lachnospiraceae bacterium]
MTTFDIHTHSVSSGHGTKDTVSDMLREASRRGLHTLGISEHGPAILNAPKPSYFRSLSFAPRKRFGIRVLYGAEVNILDGGKLDLEDDILSGLDYVIASMHHPSHRYGDRVSNTDDYIKAMSDDNVRILGHCDNTQFPVDYDAIVSSAKQYSVIVEINE